MAEYSVKVLGGGRIQLSYGEVVCALDAAGWPEAQWATATAVIAAESDRVCNIYNTYKSGHYGLMQISASAHAAWFRSLSNKNAWVDPVTNCEGGLRIYKAAGGYGPWEAYTNGRYVANRLQAAAAVQAYKTAKLAAGQPPAKNFAPRYFRPAVVKAISDVQMEQHVQAVADAVAGSAGAAGQGIAAAGDATAGAVGDVANAINSASGGLLGLSELALGAARWLGEPGNWVRIAQALAGGALLIAGVSIVARPAVQAGVKTAAGALPVGKVVKAAGAAVKKGK